MAPGGGGGQRGELAGFSDAMSLDLIGRIRDNRQIAMRLFFGGKPAPPQTMRFKAATYDIWEGRTWRRSERSRTLRRSPREGRFRLAEGARTATVRHRPGTAAVDQSDPAHGDAGDRSRLRGGRSRSRWCALSQGDARRGPGLQGGPRSDRRSRSPTRPTRSTPAVRRHPTRRSTMSGVTPPIAQLATKWAGVGTPAERARRIERHLLFDYAYTLEFIGRGGERPIEYFLLEARRGHCEYFASAMVLLLRAQGIPARLVTGFLGAEYASWERAWVVRQSNAHAWVEGYLPGVGWQIFDPTPPAGRPIGEPRESLAVGARGLGVRAFPLGPQRDLVRLLRSGRDLLSPA